MNTRVDIRPQHRVYDNQLSLPRRLSLPRVDNRRYHSAFNYWDPRKDPVS